MSKPLILAIDLGTTNCKTLLLDETLAVVDKVSLEYEIAIPHPGWTEQQPADWWAAVQSSIKILTNRNDASAIQAVGLSGQMHGLVLLDAAGEPLRPAILWNDQRTFRQCEAVYEAVGGIDGLLPYTNNPMLPGYTGSKLLWVKDNEPEIYRQGARFMLPKDYLRYRLTGDTATDVSDASGTGLFDVKHRRWSAELIDLLGLPLDWFPTAYESGEFVGSVSARAAAETGLKAGTPVIAGGGDAVMQTVGSGSVDSSIVLLVIGTAGNVTVSVPAAIHNAGAKLQVFCHVLPEQWAAMGVTLSAGSSLKWFRDTLGGLESVLARDLQLGVYDLLNAEAATSPPGANGLIFLPYLQGERAPHTDVNARGSFIGLGLYSKRADMIRAIMEGVTFSLRDVLELILASGITPSEVRSSGGGAASPVWRQIQAGVFNRVVTTIAQSEGGSALGAGIVAGVAAGMWPTAGDAVALLETETRDEPVADDAQIYQALFSIYQSLYPALKPAFDSLAAR